MTDGRDVLGKAECCLRPVRGALDEDVMRVQMLFSGRWICGLLLEGSRGCARLRSA